MSSDASVIVQPAAAPASHLFLLFHGVGATASGLVPLAQRVARAFPQAAVVSVDGPFASDLGAGRQWFSVRGVTDENRLARVTQAMPAFIAQVRHWQERFGVDAQATTLIGFSQGAIMSLESARRGHELAGRIVSIAGRFAELPQQAPSGSAVHFLHGPSDAVIPVANASDAAERLTSLGSAVTLDIDPRAGHEITPAMADRMIERLRSNAP